MGVMPRNNSGAVPPDECMVCGVHNRYPWGSHWIPGATMICDGEDPRAWKNGGPIDMSDYVREQLAALNALPGEQVRQMADELKAALPMTPGNDNERLNCEGCG